MRTVVETFRLPIALEKPVTQRVEELPYDSFSAYIVGLIRYDLLTRKPHPATGEIANLNRAQQDEIDEEIATLFRAGKNIGGGWFEARLQAAVEAAGKPEPARHKIVSELLQRLSGDERVRGDS